jgi:hypothetical protein
MPWKMTSSECLRWARMISFSSPMRWQYFSVSFSISPLSAPSGGFEDILDKSIMVIGDW